MGTRTLLVLAALVLGLGAFIFFYERDLPSTDERAARAKRVLDLDKDEVDALVIETGETRLRLERVRPADAAGSDSDDSDDSDEDPLLGRRADPWRIVEPLAARADKRAVGALLDRLLELEHSRILDGVDRADAGLETPAARVVFVAGETETALEVGAEIPASPDRIVAVRGADAVYKVPGDFYDQLLRAPGDWRDRQIFAGNRNDVERVRLRAGGEPVLLARRGERFWLESPIVDRADEDLTRALLSDLGLLEADAFVDAPLDPASLGLEPPRGLVEIFSAGAETPLRIELGAAVDGVAGRFYGRAEGQLFETETGIFATLERPADAWRSKRWTPHQVFEVEAARLEVPGEDPVAVRREDADWWRGDDRVAYSAVSDLLYALIESEGAEVLEREAAAARGHRLETPLLQIVLTAQDGEQTLALYPAVDGLAAAVADDREAVVLLPEDRLDEIRGKLDALISAEPLAAAGEEAPEPE